jgi:hypothetical protein
MKTKNPYIIAWIAILVLIIFPLLWFVAGVPAYFYALYLEGNWTKAEVKTKKELEQYLHLYSLHKIEPNDSFWGNNYVLKEGERIMQYRILWRKDCPLDVVYDENDNIKTIFTSYE